MGNCVKLLVWFSYCVYHCASLNNTMKALKISALALCTLAVLAMSTVNHYYIADGVRYESYAETPTNAQTMDAYTEVLFGLVTISQN